MVLVHDAVIKDDIALVAELDVWTHVRPQLRRRQAISLQVSLNCVVSKIVDVVSKIGLCPIDLCYS